MRGLEYSTVVIVVTFLILVTTFVLAILSRQLSGGAGWMFLVAGGILMMASGLTEEIPTVRYIERIYWGTVFIAFNILGIAFIYSGMKTILNVGLQIRWYMLIALANGVVIFSLYFTVPELRGLRTITYGVSLFLMTIPILARDYSSPPRYNLQRLFDALLLGFLASYGLRVLLALLDIREDNFIPDRMDSWIVLLYSVFGLLFLVVFILMSITEKKNHVKPFQNGNERPSLSLSGKGLTQVEAAYVDSILHGRSIKEIAYEAGISESTVRNTLSRIYRKLEVKNMVGLLALAGKVDVVD